MGLKARGVRVMPRFSKRGQGDLYPVVNISLSVRTSVPAILMVSLLTFCFGFIIFITSVLNSL